jgi:hypothetical protein
MPCASGASGMSTSLPLELSGRSRCFLFGYNSLNHRPADLAVNGLPWACTDNTAMTAM